MAKSEFIYVTYIRATPEKLWHALTSSDVIEQYWFGLTVDSDWKAGSTWRMLNDGQLMDSGKILESVPWKRLARTWLNRPGSQFIEAVSQGWPMCLSNLKSLLETGKVALDEHPGHEDR